MKGNSSSISTIAIIKRTLSTVNKKTFIIAFCSLYAVLFVSHNFVGNEKNASSLRATANRASSQGSVNTEIEVRKMQQKSSDADKSEVDAQRVSQDFGEVMSDVDRLMKEEFSVTKGWLHNAVLEAKTSVHRSLDDILRSTKDLSDRDVDDFDEEVSKLVENDLQKEFRVLVDNAAMDVKDEIESVKKAELFERNKSLEDLEADVKSIRSFFVDRMKSKVDDLEQKLESKIHTVTTKVEKDLLKKKLGVEITEEDLDEAEVVSYVSEVQDEVFEKANGETFAMQDDLEDTMKKLQQGVKAALNKFLVKDKKLSASKAEEIGKQIFDGLYDKIVPLVEVEVTKLEEIANKEIRDVEDSAADDLGIIEKAKVLGMHSEGSEDEDNLNVVDVVENKLNLLKENLENSFQDVVTASKNQLMNAVSKVTKDVEKEVFEEEGIEVSEKELTALVEKETKDIGVTTSTK